MAKPSIDISELSPDERLELIEQLWDSLSGQPDALALTDAQRQELDRRIDEMDRDRRLGEPWPDVLKSIREQK
jgi:putative addiction module component (TIGR02574 family)